MPLIPGQRGHNIGTGIARAMQIIGTIGDPRMQAGLLNQWSEDAEQRQRLGQYTGLLDNMSSAARPTGGILDMGGGVSAQPITHTKPQLTETQRGILGALPPEQGLGLLAQRAFGEPETPPPTSVMKNLAAAGLQPGTPEYQKAILEYMRKPGVTVNTGMKVPSGFMPDPNDPSKVVPIPGGPQDPGADIRDPALAKELRKSGEDIGRIETALDTYAGLIRKHGASVVPGETRAELDTAYNDLMMELKELWNLGVLQGPDLEIMQRALTPPTSMKGQLYEWFGGKGVFESQLNLVRRKINAAKQRLRQQSGRGNTVPPQTGAGGGEVTPLQGLQKNQLVPGKTYQLPDGRVGVWNGQGFEVD